MSEINTRLALLKTDLGLIRLTADQSAYLNNLLTMAASAITREGVTLTANDAECDGLVAMYAGWMYRKRQQQTEEAMPRMLRWQLNNMLAHQKMEARNDL